MNVQRLTSLGLVALLAGLTGMACPGPAADIELDESANGSEVLTPVGTKIIVTLASNATTGYAWELAELDTSILENTAHTYVPPDSDLVGAGGSERWEFTARSAGTTPLRLEYRRSWESQEIEPADTFSVSVTVQ